MTITPEEVEKLAAAATPGPWTAIADETAAHVKGFPKIEADDYEVVGLEGMYGDYETDWANAAFIAAAHDMAALIAELEAKLAKALTALVEVREFVKDLEPYADQGHSLVPALQKACAVYAELTGETDDR